MSVKRIRKEKKRILVQVDEILKSMKEYGKWWLELDSRLSDIENDIYNFKSDYIISDDTVEKSYKRYLIQRKRDRQRFKELVKFCYLLFVFIIIEALFIGFLFGLHIFWKVVVILDELLGRGYMEEYEPKEKPVHFCESCEQAFYEDDEYYNIFGHILCAECIQDFKEYA